MFFSFKTCFFRLKTIKSMLKCSFRLKQNQAKNSINDTIVFIYLFYINDLQHKEQQIFNRK